MAASTRPLLRSSRHNAGLELPATVVQNNTLPKVPLRCGKRPHDLPDEPKPAKKPRLSAEGIEHPTLTIRHRATKVIFAAATNTQGVATPSPATSAEQPISNGIGIAITTHNSTYVVPSGKSTSTVQNKDLKRSLRSHDGGLRSKSELALYFPNYDELISGEASEPGEFTQLANSIRWPH